MTRKIQNSNDTKTELGNHNHNENNLLPQSLVLRSNESKHQRHTIPAAHGFAFYIKAGSRFRIVDLHGQQVVDMMAWCAPYSSDTTCEHFSTSYTRYNLGSNAPPAVGEHLYSNHDRAMFEVLADTVKVHDMQFMACNPGLYRRLGMKGHRNCATNMAEAMGKYLKSSKNEQVEKKFEWYQVHDPFNCFQNTPYYTLKGGINSSKSGDYIEFKAEMDAVVALSSCPFEKDGFNGGKATDVAVVWEVDDGSTECEQ